MKKLSRKSNLVTKGLLEYLKETGKEKLIDEVAQSLGHEISKSKTSQKIIVTSAVALTNDEKIQLQKILNQKLQINFPLINKIDKNLIGGFTIKIRDFFLDASIAYELSNFKKHILF